MSRTGNYIRVLQRGHPRADRHGYVFEHILVAERALGTHLPEGSQVHHVNSAGHDNRPGNLVLCENQAYHSLLHSRARAAQTCGNASWRPCRHCRQYDDPSRMYIGPRQAHHRECHNRYNRKARQRRLAKQRNCRSADSEGGD